MVQPGVCFHRLIEHNNTKPEMIHQSLPRLILCTTTTTTTGSSNNPLNLPPTFRHGTPHLPSQLISKLRKRNLLPIQILIPPLNQLDKLSRVDIRVPGSVNVVDYFRG